MAEDAEPSVVQAVSVTSIPSGVQAVSAAISIRTDDDDPGDDYPLPDDSPTIKVCVRVRPFIKEEIEGSRSDGETVLCIEMPTKTSVVMLHKTPEPKSFEFDRCYWSHSEDHPLYANQDTLYEELGKGMLQQALKGFNNCIFAYGQTGSGKSFSVLGGKTPELQGLLPRIVTGLFERFAEMEDYYDKKCSVSFIEVYNEQIMDLLVPPGTPTGATGANAKLEVRQHPTLGTFIPDLTEPPVFTKEEVMNLVDYGTTMRHVSATAMNATSSRSHCIFTFKTSITKAFGMNANNSQTHLVDLAGSERAGRTKAEGARLKEGAAINQSLSTLARVISELAKLSQKGAKKKKINIPFRDSKITYILKEALSGNSKTVMMAAISPNLLDYEETLSTIKFCQTVKMVQTSAKQNQVNEKGLEAQLRNELEMLRQQLQRCQAEKDADQRTLQAALKQVQIQHDLVARNSLTSWDSRLEQEKQRQSKRSAILMNPETFQNSDLQRQMSMISSRWGDDSSDSSSDWEENSSDEYGDKLLEKHAKVQELGRQWELQKTINGSQRSRLLRSPKSGMACNDDDSDGQSSAREQVEIAKGAYEDYLQKYRCELRQELEKLANVMVDVDDRWAALGGDDMSSVPTILLARSATMTSTPSLQSSRASPEQRDAAEDRANLSLLQKQARNVKRAVDALSSAGAPQVSLRVMVAVDPSGGSDDICIQASIRSAAVGSRDDEQMDNQDLVQDTVQWLTAQELRQRWAWLEDRCEEVPEDREKQKAIEQERPKRVSMKQNTVEFFDEGEQTPETPKFAGERTQGQSKRSSMKWKSVEFDDQAVVFVPKNGRKYEDPWEEMNIAFLRTNLKEACQRSIVTTRSGALESHDAETREAQSRQDQRPELSLRSCSLGIDTSFEDASCQIDMAQAMLQSLRQQRRIARERGDTVMQESKTLGRVNSKQRLLHKKNASKTTTLERLSTVKEITHNGEAWGQAHSEGTSSPKRAAPKRLALARSKTASSIGR